MGFSPSSRGRLTDRDLDRFSGHTLFDRLARAVCHAGCLPRKELYETWEMARRILSGGCCRPACLPTLSSVPGSEELKVLNTVQYDDREEQVSKSTKSLAFREFDGLPPADDRQSELAGFLHLLLGKPTLAAAADGNARSGRRPP